MEQVNIDKIIEALKMRNVDEEGIKDFLHDLYDNGNNEEDFNYLDKETLNKLKSSSKGKDLIIKAPNMDKKELQKQIRDLLKE